MSSTQATADGAAGVDAHERHAGSLVKPSLLFLLGMVVSTQVARQVQTQACSPLGDRLFCAGLAAPRRRSYCRSIEGSFGVAAYTLTREGKGLT